MNYRKKTASVYSPIPYFLSDSLLLFDQGELHSLSIVAGVCDEADNHQMF
jgi:hypothetical protein